MSEKVEVHYSFSVVNLYSGIVEMDREEFKELNTLPDDYLVTNMFRHINPDNPQDTYPLDIDVFEV